MKKLLLSKTIYGVSLFAGLLVVTSLAACSGSGGSGGGGVTPTSTATAITIDNAGVIPVFGNSSTSTVVYVHNNTTQSISGISYSSVANSAKAHTSLSSKFSNLLKLNNSLNSVDGSQCATIAAGQSCPLAIVTPPLSGSSLQGSLKIKASYSLNKKAISFSQIINYAQVQNNQQTAGAKFKAGVDISGYGNPTGYATIYLYGSGQGQVYNVSSMTLNKPAVSIVNGNISGHQIQSNFVQAVEVSSPILASSLNATITVNSNTLSLASTPANNAIKSATKSLKSGKSLLGSGQFSNSVDLAVEPVSAGAILNTGLVPLINTVNGTSVSLLVQNGGNQTAVLGGVSAAAGISALSGCSGETLAPAASCTVNFSVTESGGSGNITIPYSGGSASSIDANVTWFNGVGAALVSMSASSNPLTFSATVGGSTTITVTNIGGYTLSNIIIPTPVVLGGSATAVLANDTCSSQALAINASCSYAVNVADSATDLNQQINLGFRASYAGTSGTQTYNRVMPLGYSSTAYGAVIGLAPVDPSLTISGNNFESTTQVLTISNSGNLPANISGVLSGNPAYLTESATTCGASLAAESSCTSTLKFGPTYSAAGDTGASSYTVDYTAVGQTPSGTVVSSIGWTVQSYAQSISLTAVESSGAASGNGLSETPYIFNGSNPASKLINLTYTNTGTNAIKITGIQNNNSVYAWSMPGDGNSCDNNVTLQPNASCSIQFENVLVTNILALGASVGAAYTENITVPTLTYQDATNSNVQFDAQPNLPTGGTTIYAQSNQATLANTVTVYQAGTTNESVTVSHLLANATGYSDVMVTTQMESYLLSGVYSSTCSSSATAGILTQTCNLSENQLSGSGTYLVNQTLLNADTALNLTTLFSTNVPAQGLVISMNPIFAITDLGVIPTTVYAYIVDAGIMTGGVTQCVVNQTTGLLGNCSLAVSGVFSQPRQIAVYNNFAYVTSASGTVSQCPITANGLTTCVDAGSSLSSVNGIAFNNGFAYIVTSGMDTIIQQCTVAPDGSLSACVAAKTFTYSDSLSGMTINNGFLYIAAEHQGDPGVQKCTISPVDGTISACVFYSQVDGSYNPIFNSPSSIAINNGFAYITNSATSGSNSNSVIQCSVNAVSGALSACAPANSGFVSPNGISIGIGFAYITNTDNNTVSSCAVNLVTGALSACANSGGTDFTGPWGIVVNFPQPG